MSDIKQVIVMRKDLNMRKGKMIAQGAHASMAFLTKGMYIAPGKDNPWAMDTDLPRATVSITEPAAQWIKDGFTKVCVYVQSLDELLAIEEAADAADLDVWPIVDKGLTEFNGVPTYTCLAIGPDYSEKIDPITGHLSLL